MTDALNIPGMAKALELDQEKLDGLRGACKQCHGFGYLSQDVYERVTRDMAIDAGDRSLEGEEILIGYEQQECRACGGSGEDPGYLPEEVAPL